MRKVTLPHYTLTIIELSVFDYSNRASVSETEREREKERTGGERIKCSRLPREAGELKL